MSHIVKAKATITYTDKELLIRALTGLGRIAENERLYRVGPGYTSERYDVVLIDEQDSKYRLGFSLKGKVWEQYQEEYGSFGPWTKGRSELIADRYLAYHYERELVEQGYEVKMMQQANGAIEIEAVEAPW